MFNPISGRSARGSATETRPEPRDIAPTLPEGVLGGVEAIRPALSMSAYGMTDRGFVRPHNEDQFVVATLTGTLWVHQSTIPQARVQCGRAAGHLLVVADGMGGHAGGEEASALAVGEVERFVLSTIGWLLRLADEDDEDGGLLDELKNALSGADASVAARAAEHPEVQEMGTTLTLAYVVGRQLYVAHAGDTRCYLFRGGALQQITRDHTLVREMVDAGVIRPEEMGKSQFRHVVTNVIGGGKKGIKAEVHRVELEEGDVVLLSSDGLHDLVDDATIADVLRVEPYPRRACETLVGAALEAGGKDNVTAVVARFDRPGAGRG